MWWEPTQQPEEATRATIDRLLGLYRETLGDREDRALWGVGSAFDSQRRTWRPLVLASLEAMNEQLGVTFTWTGQRLPATQFMAAFEPADLPVTNLLRRWDLPPDALIELTPRPIATSRVASGSPATNIGDRDNRATVGLPCRVGGGGRLNAFLTAGHLVRSGQERVAVTATKRFGKAETYECTVLRWSDPINMGADGGYDYAVVELPAEAEMQEVAHRGIQAAPIPPTRGLRGIRARSRKWATRSEGLRPFRRRTSLG